MSVSAPSAEPTQRSPWDAAGEGFLRSLVAFVLVAGIGIGIGLVEYAASGGRYHLWTWVKVGFLYLLSSCDVAIRVVFSELPGSGGHPQILYRIPLLAGTLLIVGVVAHATRAVARDAADRGTRIAAGVGAAFGFALPGALVSLPTTLRFPDLAGAVLSAVRWEAFVLVPLVAGAGAAVGLFVARRDGPAARVGGTRVAACVTGGARMFGWALVMGFVGFLALAAVRPADTSGYVRLLRGWGRSGALTAAHHALLLPDQSIWLLAPSMGGTTRIAYGPDQGAVLDVSLRGLTFVPPRTSVAGTTGTTRVPLDPDVALLLLIPLVSTVMGGRSAADAATNRLDRAALGAGSGGVFAALVAIAGWFTTAVLPYPGRWILPLGVGVRMPSTALLALVWGVVGGSVGALSAGRWSTRHGG